MDWQQRGEPLTPADKGAIRALAKKLGIARAEQVSLQRLPPSSCSFMCVKSPVVANGKRRTWSEVHVSRQDVSRRCFEERSPVQRQGRWVAMSAAPSQEEAWRVEDAGWYIDVPLDPDVPYDDAEAIVLAIRRRTMISRLPATLGPLKLDTTIPDIDLISVSISTHGPEPRSYEVGTGTTGGYVLRVKLEGNVVELHKLGTWLT